MQNIDTNEISKFEKMAESWWDQQGGLRALHAINPLRLQYIQNFTNLRNKKILDIGCGGGILAESLAKQGAIVTGIDMAEAPLAIARLHGQAHSLTIDYRQITAEELASQEAHSYDVITCMELLEHVPEPNSIINACATLIKPNGHLFLSTINRHWKAYLLAILGAEYVAGLCAKGTHDYAKFIRPSELERWLRSNNLTLKNLKGLEYNLLKSEFYLSDSVDVNYLAYAC